MKACFYDIESLSNVFTLCNYIPHENALDIYYKVDDPQTVIPVSPDVLLRKATQLIHQVNPNFDGAVYLFDLSTEDANRRLAMTFGLSDAKVINDPDSDSTYPPEFRITCDTDPDYDEDTHPFLMGYNSFNYDTTMLAAYLYEAFPRVQAEKGSFQWITPFQPVSARLMRDFNNRLFSDQFKKSMPSALTVMPVAYGGYTETNYRDARWCIRKAMLMTGRHLDVARLNEKQQHVGLKRLVGMLGGQILESQKLRPDQDTIYNIDEFLDLLAYNASDCVNLKQYVFDNPAYKGQFILKKSMLKTYPELVYQKRSDAYAPDIRPQSVRRDRLTADSSAAQIATRALCPYDHLTDIPVVSFLYPSEQKSKELGIPRVNVLEEIKKFFYKNFPQPGLRAEFDRIYNYYKSIEGKNFNASENYRHDYPDGDPCANIAVLSKADTNLFYYDKDGKPTSCFVNFSIGGIHGAEYNKELYDADMEDFLLELELYGKVQQMYPNPVDLRKAKVVEIIMPDGSTRTYPYKRFLTSKSTMNKAEYKDIQEKRPMLFKSEPGGAVKLNPKYTFTSADVSNHEDFTSYYPNLLRMMSAFFNPGLGYDRYAEVFDNKQNYGFLMKKKNADLSQENADKYKHLRVATGLPLEPLHISDEERDLYDILRNGTKLILNSASGAADANFESNIRMNNQIISMRCIGQMFSWRIGQAQALAGARIISTNTDGLFTVLEETLNNAILEQESKDIGVEIEPELTYLISKDSNNRLEMNHQTGNIDRASGGSLACREGPDPTKSLAHPALLDWALSEYLVVASHGLHGLSLSNNFDDTTGMNIIRSASKRFDKVKQMLLFQNVLASSVGSVTYIFSTVDGAPHQPIWMQHYNRVFIVKDRTKGAVHLHQAVSRVITPATVRKRKANNERAIQHDPIALQVLNLNGVTERDIDAGREASIKKVTNIEEDWYMLVVNKDLKYLSDAEVDFILDNLDYDKYLTLLRNSFQDNWRNPKPHETVENLDDENNDDTPTPPTLDANTDVSKAPPAPVAVPAPVQEPEPASAPAPEAPPEEPVVTSDAPVLPENTLEIQPASDPDECPFETDRPTATDPSLTQQLNDKLGECIKLVYQLRNAAQADIDKADKRLALLHELMNI